MSVEPDRCFFDRTGDMPKLIGCNVRNVHYRWDIYARHVAEIPKDSDVLDFGAGSLRETFDLAERGFRVTAVDMNLSAMERYARGYDWSKVKHRPSLASAIPSSGNFALVTAFDVIEHLPKPEVELAQIRALLGPGGLMFVTVPNRLTLQEFTTRRNAGRGLAPGEAHLQFKSRGEWHGFFKDCGFQIVDHDMAIGPLVNTSYLPALKLGMNRLHQALAPVMDLVDRAIKPIAAPLYGWNLIVLKRAA
jgi:SAM-dependent methyltransferase